MKIFLLFLIAVLTTSIVFSQITAAPPYPAVELPGTQVISFTSAVNHHDYELLVDLPNSYQDSTSKRYPVLYVLDGLWMFPAVRGMRGSMNYEGYLPEMIMVGIGWPDNYEVNRMRDFYPLNDQDTTANSDASEFLQLMRSEIMSFVDSAYRSDRQTNVLQGQSAGGAFALYALFHDPSLFSGFIINCPSLEYDEGIFFKDEATYAESHRELNKRIFLSSSEYEEGMATESLFNNFFEQLQQRQYEGLALDSMIVAGLGHATHYVYAVPMGLKFVFNRPDLDLGDALLDEYVGHYDAGMTISREGKRLFAHHLNGSVELHAQSSSVFYVNGIPGVTEFTRDDNGRVAAFTLAFEKDRYTMKKLD